MILPLVAKSEVTVPTVVDDVLRTVWPVAVRFVVDALVMRALVAKKVFAVNAVAEALASVV